MKRISIFLILLYTVNADSIKIDETKKPKKRVSFVEKHRSLLEKEPVDRDSSKFRNLKNLPASLSFDSSSTNSSSTPDDFLSDSSNSSSPSTTSESHEGSVRESENKLTLSDAHLDITLSNKINISQLQRRLTEILIPKKMGNESIKSLQFSGPFFMGFSDSLDSEQGFGQNTQSLVWLLKRLSRLETIELNQDYVSCNIMTLDLAWEFIALALKENKHLKNLKISGYFVPIQNGSKPGRGLRALLDTFESLPNLQSFELSGTGLTQKDCELFLEKRPSSLKSLKIGDILYTASTEDRPISFLISSPSELESFMGFIQNEEKMPTSFSVYFKKSPLRYEDPRLFSILSTNKHKFQWVKSLSLVGNFSKDIEKNNQMIAAFLDAARTSSSMTSLSLDNKLVSDEIMRSFTSLIEQNTGLEQLLFVSDGVTKSGVQRFLMSLEKITSLQSLSIETKNLGDNELEFVAHLLLKNKSISNLELRGLFGDQSAALLIPIIKKLSRLTSLTIIGNFSEATKERLLNSSHAVEKDIRSVGAPY